MKVFAILVVLLLAGLPAFSQGFFFGSPPPAYGPFGKDKAGKTSSEENANKAAVLSVFANQVNQQRALLLQQQQQQAAPIAPVAPAAPTSIDAPAPPPQI